MNKNSYNTIVHRWNEVRSHAVVNKPIIDFLERINPGGNILDVGYGTGLPIAKYFSEHNLFVTGIDFSDKMIEIAKSNDLKNAQFFVTDFYDFTSDKKFDGVIAWDSLFHFPKEGQRDIYKKVHNLLSS